MVPHPCRARNRLHTPFFRGFVHRAPPNPIAQAERQRQATRARSAVRGTFSPTGPWRPTVVARLAQTLGRTKRRVRQVLESSVRGANSRRPRVRQGRASTAVDASARGGVSQQVREGPDFSHGRLEAGQSKLTRMPPRAATAGLLPHPFALQPERHTAPLRPRRPSLEARRRAPCRAVAVHADAGYRDCSCLHASGRPE